MAHAWGDSWGSSWANSWGVPAEVGGADAGGPSPAFAPAGPALAGRPQRLINPPPLPAADVVAVVPLLRLTLHLAAVGVSTPAPPRPRRTRARARAPAPAPVAVDEARQRRQREEEWLLFGEGCS